jgi:hypothetical protein
VSEAREEGPYGLRGAQDTQRQLRRDPERAFGADERTEQVGAVVPHRELDQLAARQDDLGRKHVVDRESVLQTVRAAGVLGDVAADRADLLRRGVGRVVEAVSGDRPRHVEVRDARLDDDLAVVDVDGENARQARERDDDALGDGQRAAREPGAGAARDERHTCVVADPHDRLHLVRAPRQSDEGGDDTPAGQAVAFVRAELLGLRDHGGSRRKPLHDPRRQPHRLNLHPS